MIQRVQSKINFENEDYSGKLEKARLLLAVLDRHVMSDEGVKRTSFNNLTN
jgi:hypothetical protein